VANAVNDIRPVEKGLVYDIDIDTSLEGGESEYDRVQIFYEARGIIDDL
jgi:hypothetical protein